MQNVFNPFGFNSGPGLAVLAGILCSLSACAQTTTTTTQPTTSGNPTSTTLSGATEPPISDNSVSGMRPNSTTTPSEPTPTPEPGKTQPDSVSGMRPN